MHFIFIDLAMIIHYNLLKSMVNGGEKDGKHNTSES